MARSRIPCESGRCSLNTSKIRRNIIAVWIFWMNTVSCCARLMLNSMKNFWCEFGLAGEGLVRPLRGRGFFGAITVGSTHGYPCGCPSDSGTAPTVAHGLTFGQRSESGKGLCDVIAFR